MSTYTATLNWSLRDGKDFPLAATRALTFDAGAVAAGSPSPSIVPAPFSDPAGVDPEEMFVASLSACHMPFVHALAARAGWTMLSIAAEGVLACTIARAKPASSPTR